MYAEYPDTRKYLLGLWLSKKCWDRVISLVSHVLTEPGA